MIGTIVLVVIATGIIILKVKEKEKKRFQEKIKAYREKQLREDEAQRMF